MNVPPAGTELNTADHGTPLLEGTSLAAAGSVNKVKTQTSQH